MKVAGRLLSVGFGVGLGRGRDRDAGMGTRVLCLVFLGDLENAMDLPRCCWSWSWFCE